MVLVGFTGAAVVLVASTDGVSVAAAVAVASGVAVSAASVVADGRGVKVGRGVRDGTAVALEALKFVESQALVMARISARAKMVRTCLFKETS